MNIFACLIRVALLALALLAPAAHAEIPAMPLPGDTRLVVFRYDPNNTYTIYTMPGAVTDIELNSDEKLVALAMGDTIQWVVAKTPGHIFIKPIKSDIFTSATIVTTKRSYQLTFRAVRQGGRWYQRVSWQHPELIELAAEQAEAKAASDAVEKQRVDAVTVVPDVSPDQLNFDYDITGDDEIKPSQVFDDGRFTWIRVKNMEELPAIFMIDRDGQSDLVNYVIHGDYMVVQRILPEGVLRLGRREAHFVNNKLSKKHHLFGFSW